MVAKLSGKQALVFSVAMEVQAAGSVRVVRLVHSRKLLSRCSMASGNTIFANEGRAEKLTSRVVSPVPLKFTVVRILFLYPEV